MSDMLIRPGKPLTIVKCLLCARDGYVFPPTPSQFTERDFGYLHGFADGCKAVIKGLGPELCDRHREALSQALAARGLQAAIIPVRDK